MEKAYLYNKTRCFAALILGGLGQIKSCADAVLMRAKSKNLKKTECWKVACMLLDGWHKFKTLWLERNASFVTLNSLSQTKSRFFFRLQNASDSSEVHERADLRWYSQWMLKDLRRFRHLATGLRLCRHLLSNWGLFGIRVSVFDVCYSAGTNLLYIWWNTQSVCAPSLSRFPSHCWFLFPCLSKDSLKLR